MSQSNASARATWRWGGAIALNVVAKPLLPVYLPTGHDWYDLDSGKRHRGGQTITAHVPIGRIPVYARAGAIVPMTPGITYASQPVDVTELHVFAGADGAFTLYDDGGDGDAYLRGERAMIPLIWNDGARTLTLEAQKGSYTLARGQRRFQVVIHNGESSRSVDFLEYSGTAVTVHL